MGKEERELKRRVLRQLQEARASGISVIRLERESDVTIYEIYDMLERQKLPLETWMRLGKALDRIMRRQCREGEEGD